MVQTGADRLAVLLAGGIVGAMVFDARAGLIARNTSRCPDGLIYPDGCDVLGLLQENIFKRSDCQWRWYVRGAL